ncbi:elongation factor G-like protein EF-G2 [Nakamurella multipartita]|uniref:Small GTP-binding protein n=1 Tax=Nakamurella multipartita (strain ATCC 700099 / DSM 44233 / CIP 104796 / JCM 9543 / NBRC 105858 / Y-104) TaxID=479431 RepID=C8XG98_NAKMY|nr:elongation factor G-like protein EF-G2 [Nakamurella multipartita]ACV80100.1 small GTP-binding protein [Nakamurella multipartita DSM 44233]
MSVHDAVRSRAGDDQVRNVVLVGPGGAGKTLLAEAAVLATGALTRLGSIENGTTVCDFEDVERRLGRSVSLSVASIVATGVPEMTGPVRINLVDTPGHADFVGELRAGLRAADAALFVVSATDTAAAGGVIDGATRMLWTECAAVGMPRAVVVTHIDQPRGDFAAAVENCQLAFGDGVHPLYLPEDSAIGAPPTALVGLLSQTVYDLSSGTRTARPADEARRKAIATTRDALIEAVITESEDDGLLERYLAGEQVGFDTVVDDLEKAVAHGNFHPVIPCIPTTGLGLAELIEVICRGFPHPEEHVLPPVYTPAGAPRPALTGEADGPLVAEVVKTTTDPYVGRISIVRVFSGTLLPDVPVHVSGHFARFSGHPEDESWHAEHDLDERAGAISRPVGATLTGVGRAVAGDIVSIARLAHAETGDTLSDPADPAVLAPWVMPEPLLPVAIAARSSSDEDKLVQGLARLQAEDPTVRVEVNPATGQLIMWTMGEQQLEVLLDRFRTRSGIEVAVSGVRVAIRETLKGPGAGLGRHVKQSGGHGQYAVAQIEVEPLPEGGGFEFVDKVVGGAVPRQFIPSVEKGVRSQLDKGVNGHPMVDVRVTLVGGKAHSVDSSDAAFQMAGSLALREAASAAGVQVLEPMDAVTITVDDEYVGAVLADLAAKRGRVRGTEAAGDGRSSVQAEVPELEFIRYAIELRSLAHGTGTYSRQYLRHSPAPDHVVGRLRAEEEHA